MSLQAPEGSNTISSEKLEVSRVAFRPPPFWEAEPELWFSQIESQFHISGISADLTKFHSVVAVLDSRVLAYVRDIVQNPPSSDAYVGLKNRILGQFKQTETARLKLLLQDLQLGDRRPSHLLLEMQGLSEGKVGEEILRTLWLQRLPIHCQQILSVSSEALPGLGKVADKIYEVSGCVPVVAEVSNESVGLEALKKQVSELTRTVERLSREVVKKAKTARRGSNSRKRERAESADRTLSMGKLCWYHDRFAGRAHKCVAPCQWTGN